MLKIHVSFNTRGRWEADPAATRAASPENSPPDPNRDEILPHIPTKRRPAA